MCRFQPSLCSVTAWADSSLKVARSWVCSLGERGTVNFFSGTGPSLVEYFLMGVALKLEAALIFLTSSSSYLSLSCSSRAFYSASRRSFSRNSSLNCSRLTLRLLLDRLIPTALVVFLSDLTRCPIATFLVSLIGVALNQAVATAYFSFSSTSCLNLASLFSPLCTVERLKGAKDVSFLGEGGFTPLKVSLKSGILLALKVQDLIFLS